MAVAATAVLATLLLTGATTRLDNAIYDLTLKVEYRKPRADVVVVAMDSLPTAAGPQWPWPRRLEATLLTNIARDKPSAVALYLLFLFPSTAMDDRALHNAMTLAPTFVPTPRKAAITPHGELDRPIPEILSVAAGSGFVHQKGDNDGIVRRTALYGAFRGRITPRLVVQMARRVRPRDQGLTFDSLGGEALIPYTRPSDSFATIDAKAVLDGHAPIGFFHNKFVLIGSNASDVQDKNPTPMSSAMSDVVTDANTLAGLLDHRMIRAASPITTLLVSLAFLWTLLVALLRLGPRDNLRFAAAMIVVPVAASIFVLTMLDLWTPPASLLLTVAAVTPYWGWRRLHAASDYFAKELKGLEPPAGASAMIEPRAGARDGDLVLQQMTLLQEAKRRISDLRRFVSDILANFPDPIFVVDLNGQVLTVNEAAVQFSAQVGVLKITGAPVDSVLRRIRALDHHDLDTWPPIIDLLANVTTEATAALTGRGPDGRAFELRLTPTLNASDEPTGSIVHLADVTVLMSAVESREIAMRQREEALQLLSHDMRSPQASILAVLQDPDFQKVPERLIRRIDLQARRTLDLADAFVRLAQAESAQYILEPIDINYIAEEAVDALWSLAQQGGVTLKLEPSESEFTVIADRGAVMRALVNLLDNAVKFSSPGATVICSVRRAQLNGEEAVACEIADTAGGMPQEQADSIFERFTSSGQTAHGVSGIGLGLALVRAVAERHSGTILCRTDLGRGSTFVLTLPLYQEAGGQAAPRAVG